VVIRPSVPFTLTTKDCAATPPFAPH
jgi:hypothetical protein